MSTLFSNDHAAGGYRLRCMEVYNWGTFHKKIFKLAPNGHTTLLTGANGSGKTTLIDALLTLLVPGNKRFYNQSSGAEFKKERDENSYFWGYYGRIYSELEEMAKTEQLRHKSDNPYSVLLACFQNAATLHTITLVQVRWHAPGGLRRVFIVAPYQLSIEEHFGAGRFDTRGEWRKRLAKQFPKTDIFESFKEYAARFSDLFGLKEKALPLFNQTVGIKVLGDLTQFIRQQMLEEPEGEEQFQNLYVHYNDLLLSHRAIQKDEQQLELLEPIVKNKALIAAQQEQLAYLNLVQEQFPLLAGKLELGLLDAEITRLDNDITDEKAAEASLKTAIDQARQEEVQLEKQKTQLDIDSRIVVMEKDIQIESGAMDQKKQKAGDYLKLAAGLELHTEISDSSFKENRQRIDMMIRQTELETDTLNEKKIQAKLNQRQIADSISETQAQIESLQGRSNRIPVYLVAIRQQLLELLEAGEAELPFAGELIRVKEDCLHWENALERLLHGFSQRLLVPEKYYKYVNQYVHANNLKAKLVYEKLDRRPADVLRNLRQTEHMVIEKLDIKESGIYSKWVEQELANRYDYFCTDDLDLFHNSQKAITSNGLIRNVGRHEKDDRPGRWDKLKYTLGWNNKETIQLLIAEKRKLEATHAAETTTLQQMEPRLQALKQQQQLLTLIDVVKAFDEIHWQPHAANVQRLERQITELKQSSDQYQTICEQLEQLQQDIKKKDKAREELSRVIYRMEQKVLDMNRRILEINFDRLTTEGETAVNTFIAGMDTENQPPGDLSQLEALKKVVLSQLKAQLTQQNSILDKLKETTQEAIASFVHPSIAILSAFPDWSGDVLNIAASLSSLNELEDLYKNIRNHRLIEHKRRFQEYMDRSMLDALTSYRTWLNNEKDKIEEIIGELNVPLKKIIFNKNPDTYLQLECRTTKDVEIRQFRERLTTAIPDVIKFSGEKDTAYRQEAFNRIKDLVTELQKEETWRRKVTDVRNWLTFSAKEFTVAENKPGLYHENTASYSGGQKAQFTYAILGAAIAHQFGIFQEGRQHRSLRFITVDEAFSKLDPEKSQFLMEFCAQLHLQLLVVTPLDKINIAEPYINAVHFVEIKDKRYSCVYNLTMEEYHARKELFKQLAETAK